MKRPALPVSFAPQVGSTMVRVCTKVTGPGRSKISAPSTKNGRSSLKNRGKRWLTSIWGWSDSICEKSGLRVKSAVRFDVTPYLTLRPASGFIPRSFHPPVDRSSDPKSMPVNVGRNSRLRLVEKSVIPSISPIWRWKPATSRDIGAHTAFSSFLPLISRTIWKPHRCGSPGPRCG